MRDEIFSQVSGLLSALTLSQISEPDEYINDNDHASANFLVGLWRRRLQPVVMNSAGCVYNQGIGFHQPECACWDNCEE